MIRAMMGKKQLTEVVEKITVSGRWVAPKGCLSVEVWVIGGGGGGGSCDHAGGGGGGGGQIVHQILQVNPGQEIPIVIGLGGLLGYSTGSYTHTNSTDGESSSFGGIVALGGKAGQQAGGSYSFCGGYGGSLYAKGGDGEFGSRYGNTPPTSGAEGILIEGEVYGSGGGAGGGNYAASWDGLFSDSTDGGTNAGNGYSDKYKNGKTRYEVIGPDCNSIENILKYSSAKPNFGGGGGAANGNTSANGYLRNGGSGCVILKYQKQK